MAAYSSEPGTARILTDRHKSRYLDDRCPEIRDSSAGGYCTGYFFTLAIQLTTTVIGVWLPASTGELTRKRCPSPVTT